MSEDGAMRSIEGNALTSKARNQSAISHHFDLRSNMGIQGTEHCAGTHPTADL